MFRFDIPIPMFLISGRRLSRLWGMGTCLVLLVVSTMQIGIQVWAQDATQEKPAATQVNPVTTTVAALTPELSRESIPTDLKESGPGAVTPPAEPVLSRGKAFDVLGMMSRPEFDALSRPEGAWFVFVPVMAGNSSRGLVFRLQNLNEADIELLSDAVDGTWNELTPIEAMLVAEGKSSREERLYYQKLFDDFAADLEQQVTGVSNDLMKTRIVFDYLHQKILRNRYDLNRSSLAASLEQGVFNCVSATVLFNCLAERVGLHTAGLETTGHAKSRVLFENGFLDVETTCTRWSLLPDRFQPVESYRVARPVTEASANSPGATGSLSETYVPLSGNAGDGGPNGMSTGTLPKMGGIDQAPLPLGVAHGMKKKVMRQINAVGLTATIYYNRGVDFSQTGKFEQALDSYIKAIQLDPHNKTILGNLKATLNNWAIDLAAKEKNFPVSIRLAEWGLELDPNFEQFKTNLPIFYQHWISELEKEKRFDEAEYLSQIYRSRFGK